MYLDSSSLWLDEGYTFLSARRLLTAILRQGSCDANPVLGDILFHVWLQLFNFQIAALQVFPFVCGILFVAGIFALGMELFDKRTAFYSAAMASCSSYCVLYSQFARIYSFALLATAATIYCFARLRAERSSQRLVLFWLSSGVLLNTHVFGYFVLAALALCDFLDRPKPKTPLAKTWLVVCLSAAPTAFWAVAKFLHGPGFSWLEKPTLSTFASIWFQIAGQNYFALVALVSLNVFALLVSYRQKHCRESVTLLGCCLLVPIIIAWLLSLGSSSIFHVRYFFVIAPAFILLAGNGLSLLPNKLQGVLGSLLVITSLQSLHTYYQQRARSGFISNQYRYVSAEFLPGDTIVHETKCSYVPSLAYHDLALPEVLLSSAESSPVLKCLLGDAPRFMGATEKNQRIWLFSYDCPPRERSSRVQPKWLEDYALVESYQATGASLYRYDRITR